MSIVYRPYTAMPGITEDYRLVRDMLVTKGYCEYTYGRWDWAATHPNLDISRMKSMGLWLENGKVVAAALMDCQPGRAYLICLPGFEFLRGDMLQKARSSLRGENGGLLIAIPETDREFQAFAARNGLVPTPETERDAVFFPRETRINSALPEGYRITDMASTYDMYQYGRVLWLGFNHELNGEGPFDPNNENWCGYDATMRRENCDLSLKIAVVAPDGNFCGYCGMWYEPKAGYAVIEPVATDPAHRKKGIGRAAVMEGIRRVSALGARMAVVGSDQQFYYSIGLRPYATTVFWADK